MAVLSPTAEHTARNEPCSADDDAGASCDCEQLPSGLLLIALELGAHVRLFYLRRTLSVRVLKDGNVGSELRSRLRRHLHLQESLQTAYSLKKNVCGLGVPGARSLQGECRGTVHVFGHNLSRLSHRNLCITPRNSEGETLGGDRRWAHLKCRACCLQAVPRLAVPATTRGD